MTVSKESLRGFALEATPETDPINAVDAKYWLYGFRTLDIKEAANLPTQKYIFIPIYKANDRMPSEIIKIKSELVAGVSFLPVNCIPEYKIMGASSTPASTHTITHISSGSLPTFTDRAESSGGSVDTIISAVGSKVFTLNTHLEIFQNTGTLTQGIAYNAIKNANPPSLNQVHNGAIYPTDDGLMTGAQTKTRYRWGDDPTNQKLLWNATEYKTHALMFDSTIVNTQIAKHIANQIEPEFIDEGVYQVMFSMLIWRGEDDTIYDDYLAGTKRDLTFKIYAGATNWKQHAFTNAAILECTGPEDIQNPIWSIKGIAQKVVMTGIDGISKTEYYGE